MAGIFNLFGKIAEQDKGQLMQPLSRSKSSFGVNLSPAKTFDQPKPKGLSIRSTSELNVSACSRQDSSNQDGCSKQQKHLKPKMTQLDNNDRPVSPRKEFTAKKLNEYPSKMKDLSPKKVVLNKRNMKHQRPLDEDVFKKPLPPKKVIKKSYPEPENLAPYHDMQFEFDNMETKVIENGFKNLLTKTQTEVDDEDEGFLSDPELLEFELPKFSFSPILGFEDWKKHCTLDLPEISDNEENF